MLIQDLQFVLELARGAPLQRADQSHHVSAVLARVEEELALMIGQQAAEAVAQRQSKSQEGAAQSPPPGAVASAVSKAVKSKTGAE